MTMPTARPKQPFLTQKGEPRVRASLSSTGPVAYRPGEAIVDLNRFENGTAAPQRIIELVQKAAGLELRVDDSDLGQSRRSGFLRVRFDPAKDLPSLLQQVNGLDEFDDRSIAPNTVFIVGAFTASPMTFTAGFGADPMTFTSAFGADPMTFTNSSTARPSIRSKKLDTFPRATKGPGSATVAILDTGHTPTEAAAKCDIDFTGVGSPLRESPDNNTDTFLDIAAGHSTFIRTIIQRGSPAAQIMAEGVIHNDGDGDEVDIAHALQRVFDAVGDKTRLIVNLSFSGYYVDDVPPPMIAFWIRALVDEGAVVVAAAGNDGECRKKFPAAMPEVLSVGALGPCGPAPFSNHGSWVNVSAPGVDLVSEFFDNFDGGFEALVPESVPDIDHFTGWAMWSGTSFSTPAVVAALAEIIEMCDCPAKVAVDKLIGKPGLFRLPDYGFIVNRIF
jgi:Subtilase family